MGYQVTEGTVAFHGTCADYIAFGKGTKPLVMIQGLNTRGIRGAGLSLAVMYRIFARDYRVYIFDRRPDVWDGITIRDFAADIAAAMDVLQLKSAHVFGVSQGGMIGQYLAIDRPDLVEKLALAVTLSRNNDTVIQVVDSWIHLAQAGNMKALVADMAERMYSPQYLKRYRPLLPMLTLLQKPRDIGRFSILAQSCLTCSSYDMLDQIRCPTLVLGGSRDLVVTPEASQEIAEKIGCDLYMYESLGHAAYEEAPDFNQRVYDFFQRE